MKISSVRFTQVIQHGSQSLQTAAVGDMALGSAGTKSFREITGVEFMGFPMVKLVDHKGKEMLYPITICCIELAKDAKK